MLDPRKYIDNALLKPFLTEREIVEKAKKTEDLGIYALCVNPCHVRLVRSVLRRTKVCSVVSFPLGLSKTSLKLKETEEALRDGADEIDMVMNISAFKSGKYDLVREEIKGVVDTAEGKVVKVIIETCYLSEEEMRKAVELCVEGGAHFVKTSTGFGERGTNPEEVRKLKEFARGRIKVKASGGIRTLGQALSLLEAGAERLGTSRGIEIVEEWLGRVK